MQSFFLTMISFFILHASLFGNFYRPDRYAFPAICEEHFDNNKATTYTWLEAEDKENIVSFRYFLNLIPKPYFADCYTCCGCGGIKVCLNNDFFEWPVEDALKEITQAHMNNKGSRMWSCDRGRAEALLHNSPHRIEEIYICENAT